MLNTKCQAQQLPKLCGGLTIINIHILWLSSWDWRFFNQNCGEKDFFRHSFWLVYRCSVCHQIQTSTKTNIIFHLKCVLLFSFFGFKVTFLITLINESRGIFTLTLKLVHSRFVRDVYFIQVFKIQISFSKNWMQVLPTDL